MSLVIWPILIPFLAGILSMFAWNQLRLQRLMTLVAMLIYSWVSYTLFHEVRANGIQAITLAGWEPPFGITLVADQFSTIMIALVAVVGLSTIIFSTVNIDRQRLAFGYYPLVNILFMGISGAFLTGDMFNLYVWFEVLLISSFVLLGLGGTQQQLQGTFKYVIINLVASAIFLTALGLLYSLAGTLNMAQLALVIPERAAANPTIITTLATLFMVAFGIKAALFPFFFWMPASYHTPPVSVSALFAGLLTKVGVYSLARTFTLIFIHDINYTHAILLTLAGFTMVTGVFGAISQMEIRRILAFHSISQVGYMIMGLGLAFLSPLALAGMILYIIHHSVVKANLFLISGVVRWLRGSDDLKKLGGLVATRPYLAIMFFVTAMSLSGIPPLSGFWAKFTLIQAGILTNSWLITAVALFTGVWTLYSMTKIWAYAFWQKPKQEIVLPPDYSKAELAIHLLPVLMLMIATVVLGVAAEPVLNTVQSAANQMLDPSQYINAVQPVFYSGQ